MASTIILDDDGNLRIYDEEEGYKLLRDEEGTPFYQDFDRAIAYFHPDLASEIQQVTGRSPNFSSYQVASQAYSSGKVPWNYTNVYEGLSNRENFNLNALWGGTQYGAGRVSDFSHLDPTQLKANQIAGQTRDELWNTYNQLASQGRTPPKNPDQIALDVYVSNLGQEGRSTGYGPGVNTAALNEYIKAQFLNQPEVVSVTGSQYYTPQNKIPEIQAFGAQHSDAANTWAVFEQQGMGRDSFLDKIIQVAAMALATQGIGAAMNAIVSNIPAIANISTAIELGTTPFSAQTTMLAAQSAGMTVGESIVAAALTSGTMAEMAGGNFVDGFVAGGTGALIASGVAETGITQDISKTLQETTGISPSIADRMANVVVEPVKAATSAAATGGDAEQAALYAIAGQGLSAAGDVIADAAKTIAKDVEIKQAELPAAYTEGRMYAGANTGTMTDAQERLRIDVPFTTAFTVETAPENISIPSNTRLATYDEATSGNAMLQDLPSGEKAYLIGVQPPSHAAFQSFWDKISNIGALLAIGKPSIDAQKYTLFGSGATPGTKEGFSLFSFDDPAKQQEAIRYIEMVEQQPDTTVAEKQIAEDVKKAIINAPVLTPEEIQQVVETEPTITETQNQPSEVVAGGGDLGAEAGAAAEQAAPTAPEPTAPVAVTQEPITPVAVTQAPPTLEPSVEQAILQQILNEPTTTPSVLTQEGAPEINVPIEPVEPIDGTIDSGVSPQQEPTLVTVTDGQAEAESAYGTGGYESVSEPITSEDIYNNIYSELYGEPTGVSGEGVAGATGEMESLVSAGLAGEGYGTARGTGDVGAGEADAGTGGGEGTGVGTGTGAGEGEGEGGTEDATTRQLMNILFPRGQSFQYTGTSGGGAGTESGAYLGRGMAEGTTGEPILGVKGKQKRKVWNIESLRDALGV